MLTAVELDSVLEQHYERLRRFVRSRVSNPEEADDIVQEVCLRAVSKVATLRDTRRVESWLYQIARNAIIDHYRRTRPAAQLSDQLPGDEDVMDSSTPGFASCLPRLMEGMNESDQEALRLTAIDGLKQREVAEQLGISVSGAKSRVQRARKRFRELIDTCCHLELDVLGGVINIRPLRSCNDDHQCDCYSAAGTC